MAFKFKPKTEEQLQEEGLLPGAVYDFTVATAEDAISKAQNPMIKVKLQIFTDNGHRFVYDYLLEAMGRKLRNFCKTTGILSAYEKGEFDAPSLEGVSGKVYIEIEPAGKGYPAKNVVVDYGDDSSLLKPSLRTDAPGATAAKDDEDSEIPF